MAPPHAPAPTGARSASRQPGEGEAWTGASVEPHATQPGGNGSATPTAAVLPCERCGARPVRLVRLVEPDRATADHPLCERCWFLLVDGMSVRRPWVRHPEPQSLYVTAELAWTWMAEAAGETPRS